MSTQFAGRFLTVFKEKEENETKPDAREIPESDYDKCHFLLATTPKHTSPRVDVL